MSRLGALLQGLGGAPGATSRFLPGFVSTSGDGHGSERRERRGSINVSQADTFRKTPGGLMRQSVLPGMDYLLLFFFVVRVRVAAKNLGLGGKQ